MSATPKHQLNLDNQQLLQALLRDRQEPIFANELVRRLANCGCTRSEARCLIHNAEKAGLLVRTTSAVPHRYRLNPAWVAGAAPPVSTDVRPAQHGSPEARMPTAIAYEGPAFQGDSLAPSIGLVCGEVPPPEVALILDSIGRRFYETFHNVE